MIENFYIQAAILLELIDDTVGYGLEESAIVLLDGTTLAVNDEIIKKAEYLHNLSNVRTQRDLLLTQTDWIGMIDVPDSELKTSLFAYRQQLRDITNQVVEGELLELVWPVDPRVKEE
jgi:hypothetical protein